ncbi:MAG: ribosomal RNA small subunit methyltransferase A [Clostridiales bacterium]|nr:ribosomal RNA small subunit methyltransferase A [Clostridiales bacterium]
MEKSLKNLLLKHGFSFKKAFGQNFLTDTSLLAEIVENSGVTRDDTVLEIGMGAGALTRELAKKAKRVVGYEIDYKLKPVLSETLSEFNNVEIVFKDILKEDLKSLEKSLGENYILVANLPYYITTPIIMRFIENAKCVKSMSVMVQKEVASRLIAKPSTSDYGAITVAVNLRGNASIIKEVGREMFTPPPNVDSAVVRIDIDKNKFKSVDFAAVRDAVRCGFLSRRKMLVNNLMNSFSFSRKDAEAVLIESGFSLTCRGETLSAKDYITLSENIKKVKETSNEN